DGTFTALQDNLPKALESVPIETIWRWEHCMICRVDAYWEGLQAKEAQITMKQFSLRGCASHQRIPELVALAIDD
ncbi:hypothetical protein BDQ17DRAFT_1242839, partial [Cyathus striatus]